MKVIRTLNSHVSHFPRSCFLIALAILYIAGSSGSAATLGVNYLRNGSGVNNADSNSLPASAVAGVVPQANWNNLGKSGDSVNLVDSSGNPSGVTIAWDASGTWTQSTSNNTGGIAVTQGSPDANLMNGYLDSNGNN